MSRACAFSFQMPFSKNLAVWDPTIQPESPC